MQTIQSVIEKIIRQAQREGKFDNLPGQGKPLDLEENPYEETETRAVHRMLRNSGFSLPWIEDRKEIDEALERAQADLVRSWNWYREQCDRQMVEPWIEAEWSKSVARFLARVDAINLMVEKYNLQTPSARFQRLRIDANRIVEMIKEQHPKGFLD